ncbi:MAG: radical SAM protein [Candidatus Parcubacteria bacterium]|nr:radical SAM protein [Candidatus Parcubacteria bacterium]
MAQISYIQIIRKCNQKCLFCSNPENFKEISFAEYKKQLDDLIKLNTKEIIITGGEPTLHPQLFSFIKYALDKGMTCRIITNGQKLADSNYLNNLADSGLQHLHLSFYSYKPEIQNFLAQNKSSYSNLIKSLSNLAKYNFQVDLNCVINKYNAKHLDKNVIFIIKKFPYIKHFVFNNLDPFMNRASENSHVIPRLSDFEVSLNKALKILKLAGKSFRVERVPLCYMLDFAEFSTETRKRVKDEGRIIFFLDKRKKMVQSSDQFKYPDVKICKKCSLVSICAGLYAAGQYYNPSELRPQKFDPQKIINRISNF